MILLALTLAIACRQLGAPNMPSAHAVSVENAGLLFTDNRAGVSGTDAGYSIPLGLQTLWLFGDVFLLQPAAPAQRYVGMVANCGLLVSTGSSADVLHHYRFLTDAQTGLARQLLGRAAGEASQSRVWPLDGWTDPRTRTVYVFCQSILATGTGPFDFRVEGCGLESAETTGPQRFQFHRVPGQGGASLWWLAGSGRPLFGLSVVRGTAGGFLYVVGVVERGGRKEAVLARVLRQAIKDSTAYEYYTGKPGRDAWSPESDAAAAIDGLADFPADLSIAYNTYLGGYLAVQSVGISERIRLSLAPKPWGPYRQIAEIGAPHRAYQQAFCYAGKEHAELQQQGGRVIFVTYVDSQRYWLQLLRVTLQR